ncbi:MAG: RNA 2',3'-cyclic phosphodiesterase [Candidatus Aminicenantes bacterium]|nr:MAG: RNA 2',3'-cyclic phosphodiesterase [Candidatus Aminicenantes bacterium]
MRTFIAINLDQEIKKALLQFVTELDACNPEGRGIRWVRPEGMHLTLKFLGEIGEEKVPVIESALKGISEKHVPFPLRVKGTGSFPPKSKTPRVLWVAIEEVENLKRLQFDMEKEMEGLGFPRERRTFHPHLTLGRVKTFSGIKETLVFLEKHREKNFGEMEAKKITFFRSILKPTGAEYSVLSEFELK